MMLTAAPGEEDPRAERSPERIAPIIETLRDAWALNPALTLDALLDRARAVTDAQGPVADQRLAHGLRTIVETDGAAAIVNAAETILGDSA